jgi:hypothetical protein
MGSANVEEILFRIENKVQNMDHRRLALFSGVTRTLVLGL